MKQNIFSYHVSFSYTVDGYLIEYCTTDSDEWKTVNSQPMQSTDPYPVTGLALGKSYRLVVSRIL